MTEKVQCEACGYHTDLSNAHTERVDGGKGNTETLVFCGGCTDE